MRRPKRGPVPYYHRISEIIRERIESRELRSGDRIPSEDELCRTFQVSRTTVRQALQRLEQDRLIERQPGRGSFVCEMPEGMARLKMTCLLGDLIALGLPATAELKERAVVAPPAAVADAMGLGEDGQVLSWLKVVSVDGQPFAVRRTHLPHWMDERLDDEDLRTERLLKTLSEKCGAQCDEAEQLVEAVVADSEMASLLGVEVGDPVLSVTRTTYDRGGACIEYSVNTYRSDRTRFYIAQKQRRPSQEGWVLSAVGGRAATRERARNASGAAAGAATTSKKTKGGAHG